MSRNLQSLLIFVLVLVGLNFLLGETAYGIQISIVGSLILTLVVSFVMKAVYSGRR